MGDGFHVRLGFTAEYSNVLVVYTTLQRKKSFDVEWSTVMLEDFPKVLGNQNLSLGIYCGA